MGGFKTVSTLESDYIMMELWLHPPIDGICKAKTRETVQRAAEAILSRQLEDGGFNVYLNGPSEVNASIKAYFALKVAGLPASDSRNRCHLRDRILELGGAQAANSDVRINLSLFDLFPREACPSIPPEIILLPVQLHLPDVVLDTRDCDFTLDRACRQSASARAGRIQPR